MSLTIKKNLRWLGLILFSFHVSMASSHDSRPIYVEINEQKTEYFSVQWKAPASLPAFALPALLMPENCITIGQQLSGQYADAFTMQQSYHCPNGISGETLRLHYPNNNPSLSTLFRLNLLNGEQHTHILDPSEQHWQIPVHETRWQVSKQYSSLGFKHIFSGIDHLLFIACLLFIATGFKRLLLTISGFTLAHSFTLALSALNIFSLPTAPVEATIALSIMFLAYEIVLPNKQSWTWQHPIVVAMIFGLLHGFGFAAALKDIGLPQLEYTTALLFFNLGVELGQLCFISGVFLLTTLIGSTQVHPDNRSLRLILSYCIGAIASYWLIERILLF